MQNKITKFMQIFSFNMNNSPYYIPIPIKNPARFDEIRYNVRKFANFYSVLFIKNSRININYID